MPPDFDTYRRHLDGFDLSDEQKVELMQTVWRIMESFVDRAFGIDGVQLVLPREPPKRAASPEIVLEFDEISKTFNRIAGADAVARVPSRRRKRSP